MFLVLAGLIRLRPVLYPLVLLIGFGFFAPVWAEKNSDNSTSPAKTQVNLKRLLDGLDRNQLSSISSLVLTVDDPLVQKYIQWYRVTRTTADPPPLSDIVQFAKENPHWPEQQAVQDQTELAMVAAYGDDQFIASFIERLPRTRSGTLRLGQALIDNDRVEDGAKFIRRAWINWDWTIPDAKEFLSVYNDYLRPVDHALRLENLLWGNSRAQIKLQMTLVSPLDRAIAEARLRIQSGNYTPETAVANVPPATEVTIGMRYDLIRWFRTNDYRKKALELLEDSPRDPNPDHADQWWDERASAIRTAINLQRYDLAYKLASNHGLDTGQNDFVQAEFLSGWIALKWLKNSDMALSHFVRLIDASTLASSYARGNYWAGQAMDQANQPEKAKEWYRKAAGMVSTYYGQISAVKLGINLVEVLPTAPQLSSEQRQEFDRLEMVRLVRRLNEIGANRRIDPFILALAETINNPATASMLAGLCLESQRADLAVQVSRIAQNRKGIALVQDGFPMLEINGSASVESALIYALIRQESSFAPGVTSPVGARGLMQIMPGTAKDMAKQLKMPYSRNVLLKKLHEAPLNLQLGESYLRQLLKQYDGSYIMAIAAYNAGPGRLNQWVQEIGDPRQDNRDVVAWIEQIPILETRLYVQRILESLQVYRILMARNNGNGTINTKASYIMYPPSARGAWCLSGCLAPNKNPS
ncbi:MAG: lytic transglycosylase domain-containing protein [Candidatus Pacebacteria bacterium]|nr:lytic transglycosylase domain-containing protein [Candidatus Paceibacterota bacterium]